MPGERGAEAVGADFGLGAAEGFCGGGCGGAGLRGGSMLAVTKGSSADALAAMLAPQDKQKRPTSGTVALHAGHFANALFPSLGFRRTRTRARPEVHC